MYDMSVKEFIEQSESGNIDYRDFVAHVTKKIKTLNNEFSCVAHFADFNKRIEAKETLYGLPLSVKDNICTKNLQSTAGSKILQNYKPGFDATSIKRAKEEGGRILCKTNQDAFGFGTFCTNSYYGIPKNPNSKKRVCGGSSGGAACLTKAANFPHLAIAESTGGSITCPAAYCGVTGLTPTYGLVSRYGLIDFANSLDKIGPIGKTIYEVALCLSIIAGHDPKDSTSLNRPKKDYTEFKKNNLKGIKIGVPEEYINKADPQVQKTIYGAIEKMEELGATYEETSLPNTKYALSSYYIIACCEASTNLSKFCGMRYGLHKELKGSFHEYFSNVRKEFCTEAKRRIILGTFARMSGYRKAYYLKALKARHLVVKDFKKAFKEYDILASPSMPTIAPTFKETENMEPLDQYNMDVLTIPPNLAGLPMLSLPGGKIKDMPVGLHLIGKHLKEKLLLEVGHVLEDKL